MATYVSVPVGVVKKLEGTPGGINPIIDDLRRKHLINVDYDGKQMNLQGVSEEILDIANELLHVKAGLTAATYKTLGDEGTVVWTYRGKSVKYIQNLLDTERKELLTVKSIKIEPKENTLLISCKYGDYRSVNGMLFKLDKKIKECREKVVEVHAKDIQLARKFEKETIKKKFYCCLKVDKTGIGKAELEFHGKEERDCIDGISKWELMKRGEKTKPDSKSNTTWYSKGTESVNDTSKQPKSSDIQENKYLDNTASTNTSSPKDMPKLADADWEKTDTVTTSPSKPLPVIACASGGQIVNTHARVSTTEVKNTPGRMIGSGDMAKYSFKIEDMEVFVYKKSIIEIMGMDAIANAANESLMHGGGVAYFISKAAGKKMDHDCNVFIAKNGHLQVTQNFVSIPGDIKCKGIIHAVGPTWYDYKNRKDDCARDLYETIKNVLIAANANKWQKVALSAISSGLFGVPKKLCAEMYIKAFADFATGIGGSVTEVHFIDINREILDFVIGAHKTWMKDASKLDFKNALEYSSAVSKTENRREAMTDELDCQIQSLGTDKTSYGETIDKYLVCKKLTVLVYQGSLTRLENVDAIALTVPPDNSHMGVLESSVRNLAGHKYGQEVDKYRNGKNGKVFVSSETGKLKCRNIVHIISSPVRRLDEVSLSGLCEVYGLALTNKYKSKIRSIGMPLFGTAGADDKTNIRTLCHNVIRSLVSVCCDSSKPVTIKELHLVNLDPEISACLQGEFSKVEGRITEADKSKSYMKTQSYTGSNSVPNYEDHSWIRHTPLEKIKTTKADRNANGEETHGKLMIENAPPDGKCIYCDNIACTKIKECGHMYCTACAVPVKSSDKCLKCSTMSKENKVNAKTSEETCPICLEQLKKAEKLPCSHKLCKTCYQTVKKQKPQCPVCQHIFGDVTGNQPDGDMFYRHNKWKNLPGYDGCGTIEICYIIPQGKQKKWHPHPDKPYSGIERRAYLPDNEEGKEILHLLRRAFDRKLIFTIGESRTTGKEGVVTWNDIHHKTKPTGGPERFGYPDATYLARVREELAAKGVTE